MTLGGFDTEKFATGDLNWHDVYPNAYYWKTKLDHVGMNFSSEVNFTFAADTEVVIDTGTSYICFPYLIGKEFVSKINSELDVGCFISGWGLSVVICGCPASGVSFPDLDFVIDGHSYSLSEESYTYEVDSVCYMKIVVSNMFTEVILGLNFFE